MFSAFQKVECGPAGDAIGVSNTATFALLVKRNPKNSPNRHVRARKILRICKVPMIFRQKKGFWAKEVKSNGRLASLQRSTPSFIFQVVLNDYFSLQDLGDIRQLIVSYLGSDQRVKNNTETNPFKTLSSALQDAVQETEAWAQQYEIDGRYKDAAYLYGRIHSNLKQESRLVPTLAAVYEKMGDFPAAELAQEKLMEIVFEEEWEDPNDEQIREVNTISRLFNLFHNRVQVLDSAFQTYAKLSIVYRAAILDIEQLNIALFEQGLIVLDCFNQWSCGSLHIAAKKNASNLARLLLQKGAEPNLTDSNGATPLRVAVENRCQRIVQSLLFHGADTEIQDCHGNTALHTALSGRIDEEIISLLIAKNADIEARDLLERTPLYIAIIRNSQTTARYLIRHGADANAWCDNSQIVGTLLFEAVRQSKEWAVKLLLEGGADLQARNSIGRQTLYYAVAHGQESIVRILLDHAASLRTTIDSVYDSGVALLDFAMGKSNVTVVEMLLKAGADINGQDILGDTALHRLMRTGQQPLEQMVSLLVGLGAQINIGNSNGDTPLHLAIYHGRLKIVQMLLDAGAGPHATNMLGETPLDMVQTRALNSSDPRDKDIWHILGCDMWRSLSP